MGYILGFDGGGTKTECVLMDSSGRVIARTFTGPSNPSRIGLGPAIRAVEEAANLALREAQLRRNEITAIGAGLAGTASPEMKEHTLAALRAVFPGIAVKLLTDLEAALAAAGEGPVIVLVAGTGSAAVGRNAHNEIKRAGGWGRFSSDRGSSFDVGHRAVVTAVQSEASGLTQAPLYQQILKELGASTWADVQRRAEAAPDEIFPRVFPVIAAAADAGDPVAQDLLLTAVGELSLLVAEVADGLGLGQNGLRLAKTGGMLGRSTFLDAQLDAAIKKALPHAEIGGLKISPAEAAALAARA